MTPEQNPVEQAVSRALRENLKRILHMTEEVQQAVSEVAAACANPKPANALPQMLRAQSAAASLSASLEVLARFVTAALQPTQRVPTEQEVVPSLRVPAAEPKPAAARPAPHAPAAKHAAPAAKPQPAPVPELGLPVEVEETVETATERPFDLKRLSAEEQELHRRANRVAKVSMQDIKMLKPDQVKLGRENKDICIRLCDDIDKAHREYDRRFKPIMAHPVDYFYHWMVQILGDGDPKALGEYPYRSLAESA